MNVTTVFTICGEVLEYFDASLIGLTATPSKQTIGFFNGNLVTEYNHERVVADGVNVGYDVYRVNTNVTEREAVRCLEKLDVLVIANRQRAKRLLQSTLLQELTGEFFEL